MDPDGYAYHRRKQKDVFVKTCWRRKLKVPDGNCGGGAHIDGDFSKRSGDLLAGGGENCRKNYSGKKPLQVIDCGFLLVGLFLLAFGVPIHRSSHLDVLKNGVNLFH